MIELHARASGVLLALAFLVACDLGTTRPTAPSVTPATGAPPNQLKVWVETEFEGNGGSNYPHLKLYGNLFRPQLSSLEKIWLATHYDIVDHGSWDFPEVARRVNPQILITSHFNVAYVNRDSGTSPLESWVFSPENTGGHTLDDAVVNYAEPTVSRCGPHPAGGIVPQGKRCRWFAADSKSAAWRAWAVPTLLAAIDENPRYRRDGVMYDDVTFTNDGVYWDRSLEYEGLDPNLDTHPRVAELYDTVSYLRAAVDAAVSRPQIHIVNIGNSYWAANPDKPQRMALAQRHAPNVQDESWVIVGSSKHSPRTLLHYERTLVSPIRDFLRRDIGYMFETGEFGGSDRGRRFTLGMFYLVNHPLAFYWYRDLSASNTEPFGTWMWNPYVEVDIGQPIVNSGRRLDWEGQISTEHHVLDSSDDYLLLAREYEKALVLVKLMGGGDRPGDDPTVHALPGRFRPVRPDLGLGDPIDRITLTNNDAAILMKIEDDPPSDRRDFHRE